MNFLLVGPPGSGKTTAACSACLADPPGVLIDVDGKASQMVNLHPLIKSGALDVIRISDKLVRERFSDRALNPDKPPKQQPMGYVNTVDILNDIIDQTDPYKKYKVFILDSLTRLTEHLTRLLIYHRGQGKFGKKMEDDMNWPSWGSYKANLEELFYAICDSDKHFICTVHQKEMSETSATMVGSQVVESTIIKGYRPLIDGQMREKLAGYFNECYYMEVKDKKAGSEYYFRTRGAKYDARTSLKLDELVPADLSPIIKQSRGE
jgi:hypothetical protein